MGLWDLLLFASFLGLASYTPSFAKPIADAGGRGARRQVVSHKNAGHVDPGETERVAAERETQEEAGIAPTDYDIDERYQKKIEYTALGKPKSVVYWLARVHDPDIKVRIPSADLQENQCAQSGGVQVRLSSEHRDYKWCALADALRLVPPKHATTASLLKEADAFLTSAN